MWKRLFRLVTGSMSFFTRPTPLRWPEVTEESEASPATASWKPGLAALLKWG